MNGSYLCLKVELTAVLQRQSYECSEELKILFAQSGLIRFILPYRLKLGALHSRLKLEVLKEL